MNFQFLLKLTVTGSAQHPCILTLGLEEAQITEMLCGFLDIIQWNVCGVQYHLKITWHLVFILFVGLAALLVRQAFPSEHDLEPLRHQAHQWSNHVSPSIIVGSGHSLILGRILWAGWLGEVSLKSVSPTSFDIIWCVCINKCYEADGFGMSYQILWKTLSLT